MSQVLKFGNVLLCDHVVLGHGNKYTLVNTFSGDVIVQEFPARLMFGIYVEHIPVAEGSIELRFDFELDGKSVAHVIAGSDVKNINDPAVIAVPVFTLQCEKETVLTVVASSKGFRKKTIMKKRIFQGRIGP